MLRENLPTTSLARAVPSTRTIPDKWTDTEFGTGVQGKVFRAQKVRPTAHPTDDRAGVIV